MSYKPGDFSDVRFLSAVEKAQVANAWVRFLNSGFEFGAFTKALYNHLIQHCSFIAHFNRGSFFNTYFERPGDTERFMQQFWTGVSVEYGDNGWVQNPEYRDLNGAMTLEAQKWRAALELSLPAAARAEALAEARRVVANAVKMGVTVQEIVGK